VKIKFWGTRGSTPVPGENTLRYGGNTPCIEVRNNDIIVIIDAGTGIRELGNSLIKEFKNKKIETHVLISHTHWDHIQGIPFFKPAFINGNKITFYGVRGIDIDFENIIKGQMDTTYFPVDFSVFQSDIEFVELVDKIKIAPFNISFLFLNHPGVTVGFRLDTEKSSIAYVSDNEPYRGTMKEKWDSSVPWIQFFEKKFIDFVKDVDLCISEGQYTKEEYKSKIGWGHSTMEFTLDIAYKANVKRLVFTHYDPDHNDDFIDFRLERIKELVLKNNFGFEVTGAKEGMEIEV